MVLTHIITRNSKKVGTISLDGTIVLSSNDKTLQEILDTDYYSKAPEGGTLLTDGPQRYGAILTVIASNKYTVNPQGETAIQEQKIAVKSGNPYRQAGGRFGSGGDDSDKSKDDGKDVTINGHSLTENSTSEEVEAFVGSLKGKSAIERTRKAYDQLGYNDVAKPFTGGTKIYRYETADTIETATKYKDAIMAKKRRFPEAGNTMFGVGNYFGDNLKDVSYYKKQTSVLVSGRLAKGTKVADFKDIHNLRRTLFSKHSELIGRNPNVASVFSEYGLLAAMQGYGAIKTDGGYIVVLDRRKLNVD